jgi:serine/threonine protein kinase
MAPTYHCPNCGQPLKPDARFCSGCGASIALTNPDAAVAGPVASTIALRPQAPRVALPAGELPVGTLLGADQRYRIERSLGRGGFGLTYLARDLRLTNRKCVIKRMLVDPAWSADDERTARANFRREAELLAELNDPGHPHIPGIYEYLEDEACLVMKYIEGRSLNEGGLSPGSILDSVRDVCSALEYMHSRVPPVLHRDIKPANILLGDDEWVWLIDFGLSKSTPLQAAALPTAGTMMAGTLGYTPPEQWQSAAVPQSDVYALAATMHTLLTGYEPPFAPADLPDLISGAKGAFPPARSLNPAIDRRVELLIQRGMAASAADRPTAQQFLAELKQILRTPGSRPAASIQHGSRIRTPNGDHIRTTQGLARWCADNWLEAKEWLEGNLPDVIETSFLDAQLAKSVRKARNSYPDDPNAALDLAINLIDPGYERAWAIQFAPNPVDFGSLAVDADPVARTVAIKNTGQRYISLHLRGDDWLRLSNSRATPGEVLLSLLPGAEQRIVLYANPEKKRVGGRLAARLAVPLRNGVTETLAASASLPRWKTLWIKAIRPRLRRRSILLRRRPAQACAALAILLLLAVVYLWLFG